MLTLPVEASQAQGIERVIGQNPVAAGIAEPHNGKPTRSVKGLL
jgi:hypothetical protein